MCLAFFVIAPLRFLEFHSRLDQTSLVLTAGVKINLLYTYSASTVAADTPLSIHAFTSIDNKDLMLKCNLILRLDGMFKFQYSKKGKGRKEKLEQCQNGR